MKPKAYHFSQRKGSLATSQIQTRGKEVASTAITTTSATTVVNTNVQVEAQLVKFVVIYCLTKIHPSRKPVWQWAQRGKENRERLENFTGNENQDIYSSYGRLVPEQ